MKDKLLVEKLFREEDNSLILNKLQIHDELKNSVLEKNIDQICQLSSINKSRKLNPNDSFSFANITMSSSANCSTLQNSKISHNPKLKENSSNDRFTNAKKSKIVNLKLINR